MIITQLRAPLRADEGQWTIIPKVTVTCVGNAKYFGGGMKITPTADPFNDRFEVISFTGINRYDFILKMHTLYQGTHTHFGKVAATRTGQSNKLEIPRHPTP